MSFTKNIKTDYGATGNGQVALTNVSITSGTNTLAVSTNIFVAGDVGKTIYVYGAAPSVQLVTTISVFTDASHVTLAANASLTMTAIAMRIYWGSVDTTAFLNWQIDAQAQGTTPCVLTIPAGVYLLQSASNFYNGVYDLTINMAGATLSEFAVGGAFYQAAPGVQSARLNQVHAGDSVLSLVTPAQTSLFTVSSWVCLSSLELQGLNGYPPNFIYFEYHQIMAIGVGTITIDAPATYTHKTTYPVTGDGSYDTGGPATLFNLDPKWNQTVVVNGSPGGVLDNGGQVQVTARSITINDCTLYGRAGYLGSGAGLDPTVAQAIVFNNCTTMLGVEIDKNITSLTWNNCVVDSANYQSASIANTYVNGGTFGSIGGTSRNTTMSGCTVTGSLGMGCGYGAPQAFAASNCSFGSITTNSATRIDLSTASYTNGVFSVPNAIGYYLYRVAVPGAIAYWQASGAAGDPPNWGHQVTITDIWADATKTYVSIYPALSSPPIYLWHATEPVETATTLGIVVHSAPNATFRSCTGCVDAVDFSGASAGQPLYSYTKRTYVSDAIGTTSPNVNLWGKLAYFKITVSSAASGVGPLRVLGVDGEEILDASNFWHRNAINIQIDLSQTGVRVVTPTSVTGTTGADSITFPEGAWPTGGWIMHVINPYVGTVITGGSVTVEVATVQAPTDNPPVLYSLNSVW